MRSKRMGIIQPLGPDGEPLGLAVTGSFAMMHDPDKVHVSHADAIQDQGDIESDNLKKTKRGIILDPQPSEDIKDPLNWPIWRRDLALLCMGVHCFIGGGQVSMLSAGFTQLSEELNVPRSRVSYLVGFMTVSLAVGSIFASPTAVLFGKRGVYLTGLLISLVGLIISACANTFKLVLVGRMIAGFGLSTVESLPSATVAEIYFAHERAYRLGIYTFLFLGGKNLVPLFSALVFEWFNRRVLFGGLAVLTFINFILHILFVPETFWDRTPVPNERSLEETRIAREALAASLECPTDDNSALTSISSSAFVAATPAKGETLPYQNGSKNYSPQSLSNKSVTSQVCTLTYSAKLSQSNLTAGLRLYHGRHSDDRWYMVMVRPFILVAYPAVLFSALLYALALVFMIMISQIMDFGYKSRYHFSSLQVGLVYIAPFIGGCAGTLVVGRISDMFARYFASKNHGVYEPEFRLVMILPAVIFTFTGLLGFGWSLEGDVHWLVPTLFFGTLAFGASMGSTTVITFTIDSYKMYAQEALVTLNMFKNLMAFAVSFFNVKFTQKAGYGIPFVCYALCEVCVGLCAIPLYRWGKTFRAWTDTKGILEFSYRIKKKAVATPPQKNPTIGPQKRQPS